MTAKSTFLIIIEYFLSQLFLSSLFSIYSGNLPIIYNLTPSFVTNITGMLFTFYQYFFIPFVFIILLNILTLILLRRPFHKINLSDKIFNFRNLLSLEIFLLTPITKHNPVRGCFVSCN